MEHIKQIMESLPAVKKAPATNELTLQQTGDRFAVAVSGTKIYHLDSIEPIKEALRMAMIIVGLRGQNFPNEMEKAVLLNHIVKYYGGHTPEEIRLAFEMAVCGELELSFDEVTSYENFSLLYFGKIMNAYRNWSEVEYKQKVKEPPPAQVILTDEQLMDLHREDIENFYQRIRRGRTPYNLPAYFKDILVHDGLMKPEDDLSAFFVQRLGNSCEHIYTK